MTSCAAHATTAERHRYRQSQLDREYRLATAHPASRVPLYRRYGQYPPTTQLRIELIHLPSVHFRRFRGWRGDHTPVLRATTQPRDGSTRRNWA